MDAEQKETILTECRELMAKAKYAEDKIEQFCGTVSAILQEIVDNPDEQREVRCKVIKRLDRIECRIEVSGDRIKHLRSRGYGIFAYCLACKHVYKCIRNEENLVCRLQRRTPVAFERI